MNTLTVSLVQADLCWEQPKQNRLLLDRLLAQVDSTSDLILLPEMFTTGFSMNATALAEEMGGPTTQWLQQHAKARQSAIAGSVIIKENGFFYNRLLWVMPDGSVRHYDKRHLFTLAGEEKIYTAGQERLFIDYRGWKIMPLICYDLRFPVWSRNDCEYDLLLYVANFPDKRSYAWRNLLIARAIENQSYTIGLNRVGTDAHGIYYAGNSCVLDFAGQHLAHLGPQPMVKTLRVNKAAQQLFRKKLAFLPDQDDFSIS